MTSVDADVIVIGLGIHGSAAAAGLARRGASVLAIDRFAPGHSRGSSHGRTRMIRRAYPNSVWNGLVDRTFEAWQKLEAESGQTLIHRTGGLYAHRGEAQLQGPDCRLIEDRLELERIMPAFRVPEGHHAVYDPHAGVIEAEHGLNAIQAAATAHGAELRWGVQVLGWECRDGHVRVGTDAGDLFARKLVIAGGGFIGGLVPELAPLLEVWRILTLTVEAGQLDGMPPRLGALSVDRPEGLVFGIPDAAGNGFKLGVDAGQIWDPETPVEAPTAEEVRTLRALIADYVPGLNAEPVEAASCLYTMTGDKRFIIGPLKRSPQVMVVSACSGHGFKFGPAIGEAVADLCAGIPREDLAFISTSRRNL